MVDGSLEGELQSIIRSGLANLDSEETLRELTRLGEDLSGPLTIGIQGEVSSGKSTIVNALLGERVSATKLEICTTSVTYYRQGEPRLEIHLKSGATESLPYNGGRIDPSLLDGFHVGDVDYLAVWLEQPRLADVVIVDFPGQNSLGEEAKEAERLGTAPDAHIYVTDKVTRGDIAQLTDLKRNASDFGISALNLAAVLSKVDTLGGAIEQQDPLEAARRMSRRTAEQYAALVNTVVPTAALLAEAVYSGDIDETFYGLLLELSKDRDNVPLNGADIFVDICPVLTRTERSRIVDSIGIYALEQILDDFDRISSAEALKSRLLDWSGVNELEQVIFDRFLPIAREVKAATTAGRLRQIISLSDHSHRNALLDRVNDLVSHHELRRLEQADALMRVGQVLPSDGLNEQEVARALMGRTSYEKMGLLEDHDIDDLKAMARRASLGWRASTASGFSPAMRFVSDVMQRTYRDIWQES